jgi:hypothetical protein
MLRLWRMEIRVYSLAYIYPPESALINKSMINIVQIKLTQPYQMKVLKFIALPSVSLLSHSIHFRDGRFEEHRDF